MKKEFHLKNHLVILLILIMAALTLDFFTPGLDLLGFQWGRPATASLVIDYGQGRIRQFTGEIIDQMTVFDVLMASSGGGLKVDYAHKGDELTFFSIDGRNGELKIKVNGRLIQVEKLNETLVTQGDLIRVELP